MTTQPLVSIAMPVYNAEKYLKKAVDSVLNQTYGNLELVMVNDASTDSSKEIILSYNDPRIRYVENEVNLGIVKTRNKCIEHANGKYIAILDNDDIALPRRIEKQVAFMEENTGYGLCGSFYDIINSEGQLVAKMSLPSTDIQVKTYLIFDNCFCNSSVMMRSELIKGRLYPEGFDMVEDYHFLITLSKQFKLANLPLFSTQYRIHGKNTSIEKLDDMRALRMKMDKLALEELGIPFSEQELLLHSNFANQNYRFFKTNEQLTGLQNWLLKLYQFLTVGNRYDAAVIRQVFIRRWLLLIFQTRRISYKLLINKLSLRFNFSYARFFLGLLIEKYSKSKSFT